MKEIVEVLVYILILFGAVLHLAAAIGVVRLPDVYTRNHAASKATTLGISCILLGTFFYYYLEVGAFNSRLILAILFIFLTSPVSGHLINRAAYNSGVKLWDKSVCDALDDEKKEREV